MTPLSERTSGIRSGLENDFLELVAARQGRSGLQDRQSEPETFFLQGHCSRVSSSEERDPALTFDDEKVFLPGGLLHRSIVDGYDEVRAVQ